MASSMSQGAVAMMDALGTRGVGQGPDAGVAALATLRAAVKTATDTRKRLQTILIPKHFQAEFKVKPRVTVLAFSDTIGIAATAPKGADLSPVLKWGLVDLVCQCAAFVMRDSAKAEPPTTYRGVVAFGGMLLSGPCMVGPAVDEAGEYMGTADGAFVWLLPSAATLLPWPFPARRWQAQVFEYDVPLKGGQIVNAPTVGPFIDTSDDEDRQKILKGYLEAMKGPRVDVTIKRQNAAKFLKFAQGAQRSRPAGRPIRPLPNLS